MVELPRLTGQVPVFPDDRFAGSKSFDAFVDGVFAGYKIECEIFSETTKIERAFDGGVLKQGSDFGCESNAASG